MDQQQHILLAFKVYLKLHQPLDSAAYNTLVGQINRYAHKLALEVRGGGRLRRARLHFRGTFSRSAMAFKRDALRERLDRLPLVAQLDVGPLIEIHL